MNAQEVMAILIFVSACMLIGVIIAVSVFREKKRQLLLQQWAQARGWAYYRENDEALAKQCADFRCLRQKDRQQCYNRIIGEFGGRPFLTFDYLTRGNGKKKRIHRYSVVLMHSGLPLESLLIHPQNFLYDIAQKIGSKDIDFSSHEFNRKFVVKAENEQWAQQVIHDTVIQMLLKDPIYSVEFNQSNVLVCKSGNSAPEEYESALELAKSMIDLLPEPVLRQLQSQLNPTA